MEPIPPFRSTESKSLAIFSFPFTLCFQIFLSFFMAQLMSFQPQKHYYLAYTGIVFHQELNSALYEKKDIVVTLP